jgi:two-component system LytT family sensor kinase
MRRSLTAFLARLAGWTAIGLFFGSQAVIYAAYGGREVNWTRSLGAAVADWWVWGLLAPAILALARRAPIDRATWRRAVPLHLAASLAFALTKITVRWGLGQLVPAVATVKLEFLLLGQTHLNMATYWAILGAGWAVHYYRKYRERELHASQLESQLARAQLQALRTQLQPHFLFNTLHTISAFMQEGEIEAADRMITRLSDLLRFTLERASGPEVTLQEELEFLRRYLEIQQIRFQDQLRVRVDVAPEALDALVPSLILQPLAENAIRHGIGPRASGGELAVRGVRAGETLQLEVLDDGVGMRDPARAEHAGGVGLRNTRARLAQLYGSAHEFTLRSEPGGGTAIMIVVPFRTARTSTHPLAVGPDR